MLPSSCNFRNVLFILSYTNFLEQFRNADTTAIQNISDWCRHLYSRCGSAKQRSMVGLPCLVSHCAKLGGRGQFSHAFSGEVYDFYSASPEYCAFLYVLYYCLADVGFTLFRGHEGP
jgi:hypothetical protein